MHQWFAPLSKCGGDVVRSGLIAFWLFAVAAHLHVAEPILRSMYCALPAFCSYGCAYLQTFVRRTLIKITVLREIFFFLAEFVIFARFIPAPNC
jgi:hypothetical protein